MADDKRISELPDADALGNSDKGEVLQGGTNKAFTFLQVKSYLSNVFQLLSGKNTSDGYAGLNGFQILFKNVSGAFSSYLQHNNTGARTYTFQDRNGTVADDIDILRIETIAKRPFLLGFYKVDTGTVVAPVASGDLAYSNATQVDALNLFVHYLSDGGTDLNLFLSLVSTGVKIIIQDKNNVANYQIWEISSVPSFSTPTWTIPVTLVSSSGTGSTNFSNNLDLFVAVYGGAGGGGGGGGDMYKAVYDTDNDGSVDKSETVQIIVRNSTGATLTKGQIVYLSGATGNRPNAVLSKADAEATSSKTIGWVIADIANNADGYIGVSGSQHNLNTSAFADGDALWLSAATAGAMTATMPTQPNHAVFIGYVARAHPTLGRIVYLIKNGYELQELHNVLITSVANNDGLFYDSATSLWKNKTIATVLGYTAANDASVVKLTGDQTVAGIKTFSSFPVTPSSAPTTDYQVSNKKYVDDKVIAVTDFPLAASCLLMLK